MAAGARGVVEKLGNRVVISSDTLIYPVLNGFGVKKGNMEVKNALEEALKKYSAGEIAEVGAKLEVEDVFGYDVDEEALGQQ